MADAAEHMTEAQEILFTDETLSTNSSSSGAAAYARESQTREYGKANRLP